MKKKIFIDLGNVLCYFNHAQRLENMSNAFQIEAKTLHEMFWESGFDHHGDQGRYSLDEMCHFIRRQTGSTLGNMTIAELWTSAFTLNTEITEIIQTLAKPCDRILLTDNSPLVESGISTIFPAIDAYIDERLFSYHFHDQKINLSMFQKIIRRYRCSPSMMLLIDDNPSVLSVAEASGMNTIHYTKLTNHTELKYMLDRFITRPSFT
ncbi:hypothetical protein RND59_04150 [Vibrio ruber]|uniref:hypothetical protein n=1 Tax=Vibrio ruber TaxID=184755 RepID=UPI0028930275|nr:hypothetical protein [Vibrio ruber]WNJ96297.1 hypothetical protein RND59_04150 [Vibrio ruber]